MPKHFLTFTHKHTAPGITKRSDIQVLTSTNRPCLASGIRHAQGGMAVSHITGIHPSIHFQLPQFGAMGLLGFIPDVMGQDVGYTSLS